MKVLKEGFDGNHFDKYSSKNIFVKTIMANFEKNLTNFVNKFDSKNFFDLGCGDGYWMNYYHKKGFFVRGGDYSKKQLKNINEKYNFNGYEIDIYNSNFVYEMNEILKNEKINNILFSEVLEHLYRPNYILKKLSELNFQKMIITVPNEPIWRILNILRFKYLKDFGNTPGHVNHFSKKKLLKIFYENNLNVENILISQPFILVLIKK
jgi:2-polyprenyl-3-methyl-5-hydroxy-6-metoxy-1,4-benzoquinol methylase